MAKATKYPRTPATKSIAVKWMSYASRCLSISLDPKVALSKLGIPIMLQRYIDIDCDELMSRLAGVTIMEGLRLNA